ncbi:uncharacterized protein LOC117182960 [Belonocnema kinseyi]|uniref:uncharacterized protein LOC117182960 n=1 Tax=Belonocnema kinseyi TaxID=2817044 RepID=UPI00143D6C84|nr:uncharacterized protein LOC117182960 [Belonocnema kinseyi]
MCVAFYFGVVDAECVVDPISGETISGKNRDKCDTGSDCCSTICEVPKLLDLEKKRALWTVKDVGVLESPVVKIGVDKIQGKTPLGQLLVDFAHNSTIHGLNHLAVPRRHICERCFLGGTIIISLILLILLSLQPWERYQHDATVISLDNNYRNFDVTIPSFTLCPVNPVNETKFKTVFKKYWFANNSRIIPEVNPPDRQYYNFHNKKFNIVSGLPKIDTKIEVHYPDEIFLKPRLNLESQRQYKLDIFVDEFNSSSQVRLLVPQQRHCKFLNDGGLKMWPVYTLNMCILECKYNQMYKACGCHPHFARPMKGIPVCNASQLRCIGTSDPPVYLIKNEYKECGCFVNCNSAFYTINSNKFKLTKEFGNISAAHMLLNIPLRKFIRNQIFGWNDFLISVGGACNLLLGASLISVVEVIYYASLRLCCYYRYLKVQKNRRITVTNNLFKKE